MVYNQCRLASTRRIRLIKNECMKEENVRSLLERNDEEETGMQREREESSLGVAARVFI
jgi:hypothetical protein